MRTPAIQNFVKAHLLPHFPSFSIAGKVMFEEPIGDVLRGGYFEDSEAFPTSVYVWVFVQPLYIPRDYFFFTLGKRLTYKPGFFARSEVWNLHLAETGPFLKKAIELQGLPHIAKLRSPELLAENATWVSGLLGDSRVAEIVAYSLIRLGEVKNGAKRLQSVLKQAREREHAEVVTKCTELLRAVEQRECEVQALLGEWRMQTARNLRLPVEKL